MPPPPSTPAPLLATSLIIAEFDIDTGACLRACYPRAAASPTSPSGPSPYSVEAAVPPGIAGHTEYFANVMLPDGAEKVSVTRTVFVVNRPQPPTHVRFPVYRFLHGAPAAAAAPRADAPPSPPPPQLPTGMDSAARWHRAPGEDTALYVPEILLLDSTSEALSLKYRDTQISSPAVVPMESISSVSSIPPDVLRFSKQLEAMLMNEATLAGSRTASFAGGSGGDGSGGGMDANSGGSGGSGNRAGCPGGAAGSSGSGHNADYAFVVVDYAADRQEGYLMRSAHFDRFLKALTTMAHTEKSSSAAPEAPSESTAPPEDESGPLGAYTAERNLHAAEGSQLALCDSSQYPHSESVVDSAPHSTTVRGFEAESGSSENLPPREPHSGLGGGESTLTSTAEQSGHLLLPHTDTMDVSDAGDLLEERGVGGSAYRGAATHVDPAGASATPVPPSQNQPQQHSKRTATGAAMTFDDTEGPVLFGLCAVVSKRDSTARRGGITKSVAVLGPSLVWLEPFFPVLVAAAQYCCDVSGTEESALKELQRILKLCYSSINNAAGVVAAGRAKVDQLTAEIGKYCTLGSGQQAYVYYNDAPFGTSVKAKIPLSPESNDIAFSRYSLETLIEALGPSSMQLVLGILTEKKILILSRKGEAADVCEVALSLGIIGNLLDRGFIAKKVFPYVSVSSVDHFLHVPGYVVGTLNPIFENVTPWGWDLLCDLDNKTVVTAAERQLRRATSSSSASGGGNWATATAGLANAVGVGGGADAEALRNLPAPVQQLFKRLMNSIYHLRALRVSAAERNRRLRLNLEDFLYTTVLVGYVGGGNISIPTALYPAFAHRSLAALRQEMMLTSMLDKVSSQVLHPGENPALPLCCTALRQCSLSESPVQRILQALLGLLTSPYDVKLFLRRMTLAVGGLNAVGMQLTNPSAEARVAAAALLARVESIPEGKAAVASMNNFFLMIYENGVRVSAP